MAKAGPEVMESSRKGEAQEMSKSGSRHPSAHGSASISTSMAPDQLLPSSGNAVAHLPFSPSSHRYVGPSSQSQQAIAVLGSGQGRNSATIGLAPEKLFSSELNSVSGSSVSLYQVCFQPVTFK